MEEEVVAENDSGSKWRSGGFDCNICLDLVQEPVVTLCGHLYCWPCIYKWIHFHCLSSGADPNCPVCKSEISQSTLVPLYGRGRPAKSAKRSPNLGVVVPRRPPPSPGSRQNQQQRCLCCYPPRTTLHPVTAMFGDMIFSRFFGESETGLYGNYNPTTSRSYRPAGMGSPRGRRQVMEAEESLGRVCFFLCCCVVLCLLLF